MGEPTVADGLFRASLALVSKLDDPWGRSIAVRALAGLLLEEGRGMVALRRERAAVSPDRRHARSRAGPARDGKAALRAGAASYAENVFAEALALWRDVGINAGVVRCLAGLAAAAAGQRHLERAARLHAAATAQARAVGVSYSPADSQEHDRTIADLRAHLGAGRFGAFWAAGHAMSLDQAIADALSKSV